MDKSPMQQLSCWEERTSPHEHMHACTHTRLHTCLKSLHTHMCTHGHTHFHCQVLVYV